MLFSVCNLNYLFQVHGLCGNCNGKKDDDLETISGKVVSTFAEFAKSYTLAGCSADVPEPIACTDDDKRKWFVGVVVSMKHKCL